MTEVYIAILSGLYIVFIIGHMICLKLQDAKVEIMSTHINYSQTSLIDNVDILTILDMNFGNIQEIVSRYLDSDEFAR
jgi:hypothetical protein